MKEFPGQAADSDGVFSDWSVRISKKGFARIGKKIVFSNLTDCHVHFRIPGGEHKEDWKTGSTSAAAGGITRVLEMPNTSPPTTNQEILNQKIAVASRDSVVNFGFFLGATPGNGLDLETAFPVVGIKVFAGSSTGNLLVNKPGDLEMVFRIAKKRGVPVCVHAESEETISANLNLARQKGWDHCRFHSKIRSAEAEANSISACIGLSEKIGNRLHVCHVSSAAGLEAIASAKSGGTALLSCEVSPHHLFFSEKDSEKLGNFLKVNPSVKSKADQKALWHGIRKGVVDCVASDHAPHSLAEKQLPYLAAPSGVPGVETLLPVLLDAVNREKISFSDIGRLVGDSSQAFFGRKPKRNCFTLVDPTRRQVIQAAALHSKCAWSPFDGRQLTGTVDSTWVNGRLVFQTNAIEQNESRGVLG